MTTKPVTTTPTAANDNHCARPASFDAAIIQWLPLMHKIAARLEDREQDRDDLVQEAVESALANWATYNPANKMSGWLAWRVRAAQSHRLRQRSVRAESINRHDAVTEPVQEHAADLSMAWEAIGNDRAGKIVRRVAMGEQQAEIGREQGVSRERIKQLYHKRVGELRAEFGYAVAA